MAKGAKKAATPAPEKTAKKAPAKKAAPKKAAKKSAEKTSAGRGLDRALVAGGQDYEVNYEAKNGENHSVGSEKSN